MTDSTPKPPAPPIPIPKSYTKERVEKNFWPKLKRVVARVPGASDFLALYFYMNSDKAPLQHKLSIVASLAYFIMPMDLMPDFLGAMGYTDDLAVALGLIKFIGSDIMNPYRVYARKWLLGKGRAKKNAAAPPKQLPALPREQES